MFIHSSLTSSKVNNISVQGKYSSGELGLDQPSGSHLLVVLVFLMNTVEMFIILILIIVIS